MKEEVHGRAVLEKVRLEAQAGDKRGRDGSAADEDEGEQGGGRKRART